MRVRDHAATLWHLQVGDVETEVTDNFNFDVRTRRVTFVAQDGIWALRFGTVGAYDKFVTQYNSHLFENTYGLDNDEANRTKVTCIVSLCALLCAHGARSHHHIVHMADAMRDAQILSVGVRQGFFCDIGQGERRFSQAVGC